MKGRCWLGALRGRFGHNLAPRASLSATVGMRCIPDITGSPTGSGHGPRCVPGTTAAIPPTAEAPPALLIFGSGPVSCLMGRFDGAPHQVVSSQKATSRPSLSATLRAPSATSAFAAPRRPMLEFKAIESARHLADRSGLQPSAPTNQVTFVSSQEERDCRA
jgi:hypothetical protein